MSFVQLLATDRQHSVLNGAHNQARAYTAYGSTAAQGGPMSAFCGEPRDELTACYHLGNGYRQFNPAIMRLHSPDSRSPFGEGGVNSYAYCAGDPVNKYDPTGRVLEWIPVGTQAFSSPSTALAAGNRRALVVTKQRVQRAQGETVSQAPLLPELADSLIGYAAAPMGAVANVTRNVLQTPSSPAASLAGQLAWAGAASSGFVAVGTNLHSYQTFRTWTALADQHGINRWSVAIEAMGQVLLPSFVRRAALQAGIRTGKAALDTVHWAYRLPGAALARQVSRADEDVLNSVMVRSR